MAHTYSSLLTHIVFSTKNRQPIITPDLRDPLFRYMGGIVRELDAKALIVGGHVDHVHLLVSLPTKLSIADLLRVLKTNSSRWMSETHCPQFAWQTGYGAFTVSYSALERVRDYIANQEEHHKRMTFQDEFLAFLKKHHIEHDPRFIWE